MSMPKGEVQGRAGGVMLLLVYTTSRARNQIVPYPARLGGTYPAGPLFTRLDWYQ